MIQYIYFSRCSLETFTLTTSRYKEECFVYSYIVTEKNWKQYKYPSGQKWIKYDLFVC